MSYTVLSYLAPIVIVVGYELTLTNKTECKALLDEFSSHLCESCVQEIAPYECFFCNTWFCIKCWKVHREIHYL